MAQVTADVVAGQQERVIPALKKMFNMDVGIFGKIAAKPGQKVSSRVTRIVLRTRAGGRSGAVNLAGGALGRGTASKYDVATLAPRSARHALEINDDAMIQTGGKPQAVFDLLKEEIKQAMREFRKFFDRQFQTGGDGVLAEISASPGGNVFTLTVAPFFAQLLSERQKVSVYDTTLATKRGEMEITTIEEELNIINTDGTPGGTIVGDKLLPEGLSGATPAWYFGIPFHISSAASGTWLGLNRATEPRIRSHAVAAASNALSPTHARTLLDKVKQRVGTEGFETGRWLWHIHPAQKKAWEDLAVLIERIDIGSGNKAVDLLPFNKYSISGIRLFENIHAARDRVDLMALDDWIRVESQTINWYEKEGRRMFNPVDTTSGAPLAATLMYLIAFLEFACVNPPGSGAITGLAIPTGYTTL